MAESNYMADLEQYRAQLKEIDKELIGLLDDRMSISKSIGKLKFKNEIDIEQVDFWEESSENRMKMIDDLNISRAFAEEIFEIIHKESINVQHEVFIELSNE